MWRRMIPAILGLSLAACARATTLDQSAPDPDSIYAPEIVAARANDAYDAVVRLRPEFLQGSLAPSHLDESSGAVRVYLDDRELGGPDALRSVHLDDVTQIKFLTPGQALVRWGVRYVKGVILVSTSPFRN